MIGLEQVQYSYNFLGKNYCILEMQKVEDNKLKSYGFEGLNYKITKREGSKTQLRKNKQDE